MFKIFDGFITLKDANGHSGKEFERLEINRATETHIYGENYDGHTHKILKNDIFRILDYRGYFVDFKKLKG